MGPAATHSSADDTDATISDLSIRRVCTYIRQHADRTLTLKTLAQIAKISPAHLQRRFTAVLGCSPKAWQRACRDQLLRQHLRTEKNVADAVYAAGFGSGSRVYEYAHTRLGMTPKQYAQGGAGLHISVALSVTDFGQLIIAATDHGICAVRIGADAEQLHQEIQREFPKATITNIPTHAHGALAQWVRYVTLLLAGQAIPEPVPLAPQGSDFQLRVWELLRRIPLGETRSYSQLAEALGQPRAARAVARACATNPIAVLIPCHRVIRGNGDLAGYRWGLAIKRHLLAAESANSLSTPHNTNQQRS